MIKNIGWGLLLSIVSIGINAQDIATSPYSSLGYGEKKFHHGASSLGMGSISTSYLSPYGNEANFSNPAANNNLLYTTFSFEGTGSFSQFKESELKSERSTTYLSKISLAFPMGKKFKGGIGFQPFSGVGYDIGIYDLDSDPRQVSLYKGDGGINSFNAFVSYNINNQLSIGLRADYLFGELRKNEIFSVEDTQLLTDYTYEDKLNGFNFVTGISYHKKINDNNRLFAGATYGMGSPMKAEQNYTISTYQLASSTSEPLNKDIIYESSSDESIDFPQQASISFSYGRDLKWLLGAQVDWEKTSTLNFVNQTSKLNDRLRVGVGGYYIPQFNSFRSYFQRVTYRFGGFYENTPYEVNNDPINRYGITFGFGLPVGKSNDPSQINFGVELGQQGNGDKNILNENFANIKLSFNLNDSWFQKRKYD